ncbi:hypothetical protein IWQ60_000064 [Tieghemiomyces parasiticus]|uniref:Oxidase FUB9 n=1 Tax=Tieghemiomyces parasiticus TaxID=78921 RepID=A0A9W8AJK0_9FUNG|nr:hypothetical protein IWQ60_000064 [Tieghemiomyces parasiticus]
MAPNAMAKPTCVNDYEPLAKDRLPKMVWDYYAAGANDMLTLQDNTRAFLNPICVAPSALQKMAHPDGEEAVSRAVAKFGSAMVLSTYSTTPLETVIAQGGPDCSYWFQLYLYQNRPVSADLIRRAEAAGYRALVLTVDTPMIGRRLPDARNGFHLPKPWRLANFPPETRILTASQRAALAAKATSDVVPGTRVITEDLSNRTDSTLTWKTAIPWLRQVTNLPIVLKGILTRADAELAVAHDVDAIWVSNHAGRQLDTVQATIDALRDVVDGAAGQLEVYCDSGVRTGVDVFRALALGARAVFIGRPALWGLTVDGEAGVRDVLGILQEELETSMALTGCASVADIEPQCLTMTLPSNL